MPRGARFLRAAALFLLPALLGALACSSGRSPAPKSPPASLLLVTIDTWRWDYIGASGSGKAQTPNLDRLAGRGVYEREVMTPCPLTTPAHAILLTGLNPLDHGVLDCACFPLAREVPTLAEAFRAAGYQTGAFVSSVTLARRLGLDRGFDTYDDTGVRMRDASDLASARRTGEETTAAAATWLRNLPAARPCFLWVHYFDLHAPYDPIPEFDARFPGAPYAARAAYVDAQVGRLLEALGADRSRAWRVVVVGDHGESFGEHHETGHGFTLYRSTLHVPLVVDPRPSEPLRHAGPWSLADLSPTLRKWFDLPPAPRGDGESLFDRGSAERALPVLTLYPSFMFGVNPGLGVRRGRWLCLRQGSEELYDLGSDPDEEKNLARSPDSKTELKEMGLLFDAGFPAQRLQDLLHPQSQAPSRDLEALRGLGYVEGHPVDLVELQTAFIGDVLEDYKPVVASLAAFPKNRDWAATERAYRSFLARYPRGAEVWSQFGKLLLAHGNRKDAEAAFKNAARLNPRDAEALLDLGALSMDGGRTDEARVLLLQAENLNPQDARIQLDLGILFLSHLDRPADALPHLKRFLDLDPGSERSAAVREAVRRIEEAAKPHGGSEK
jgi:choline-sulfatase